eukprot:2449317-Prymnesium_polylepis.1
MQWSGLQCSLESERGFTVGQFHQRKALSTAVQPRVRSVKRRRAIKASSQKVEFIDGLDVGS